MKANYAYKVLLTLILSLTSYVSHAVGNVYIQNNTKDSLQIHTEQSGYSQLNPGEHYQQTKSAMIEWQKQAKVLWYNRDQGIKWGKTFYFDTHLSINGEPLVTLKQKLKGTMMFSTLWFGVEGGDFTDTWHQGYDIQTQAFTVNGKNYLIKYSADYNAGTASDDIVYAIHEVAPYSLPSATEDKQLKVLSYNLYTILTRTAADINRRISAVVDVLSGYDVIIFEEAFYNSARTDLINNISHEYPYTTDILDTNGYAEDGGVFIASRWPITQEAQMKFDACSGVDCLSPKGVMYAGIQKGSENYHIFGTHLQAENSSSAVNARSNQLSELAQFIQAQSIPTSEAVIIGGDLNVDKINHGSEYNSMLNLLSATEPAIASFSHHRTSDTQTNNMAGENSWLDYVLFSQNFKQPIQAEEAVLVLKSDRNSMFGTWDFSDHYAVYGYFEFD